MNNKYRRLIGEQDNDNDFWPSFTDLLSTFLLVVLLILVAIIINIHMDNVKKQEQMSAQAEAMEDQKREIEIQQEKIDYLTGVRRDIAEDLQAEFAKNNLSINIDAETGAINFDNDLLFETGKYVIRPEFKEELKSFIPVYINTLYQHHKDDIAEIVVEGHTDDVGSYLYNLELSQDRAFSVVYYILSDEFGDFNYKDELKMDITANGRSESMLKDTAEKSRRVEFKFRLKNSIDSLGEE